MRIAPIHGLWSPAAPPTIIRSPSTTRGLAPNSPVRRTDQNRLVRPDVEPDVGLATTWKTPRRNADLAPLAKLQITVFRRELDRQPLPRNKKLAHISRVPLPSLGRSCSAGNQRGQASLEVAYLPHGLLPLDPHRKLPCCLLQLRQQSCQLVQLISSGYSKYALAHAVASSVECSLVR